MVKVIDPEIEETVYDPCCGTGGFLAQAYQHMKGKAKLPQILKFLKQEPFMVEKKKILFIPLL